MQAPGDSETQWSRLAARYLRKEFALKKEIKRATVHIAGMGLYELFINGQRIGDQVLAPLLPITGRQSCITHMMSLPNFSKRTPSVLL
ncbi:alpha-L-rhamnosidase N-terminal domain-containing protein [Bacteroides thetaiotaomicron]|nr:alpha-L-rhamnosidase N-terminal domain-containing protein [Bacteroides thetaiotaomicron]